MKLEGWHNWGKAENELTVSYAEYQSVGPGADSDSRVNWSRQLSDEEVSEFQVNDILSGKDNWAPQT